MSEKTNEVLEELKREAASLGVKHNASIGEAKLKEKIEAHYNAQETSGDSVAALVAKNEEKNKETPIAKQPKSKGLIRIAAEKAAKTTRIVTIIDNDQRQNNETTMCTVSCSNQFFNLGMRHIPLGEKVEVCQGHINVLKAVRIPIHTRNPKTGLSITKRRARYSISYEDVQ